MIEAPDVFETATKWSVRARVVVAVYLLVRIRRPPVVARLFPDKAPELVTVAPVTVPELAQ